MIRARTVDDAILRVDSILNSAPSLSVVQQIEARWKRACGKLNYWAQINYNFQDPAASHLIAHAKVLWNHVNDEARSVREQFAIMELT